MMWSVLKNFIRQFHDAPVKNIQSIIQASLLLINPSSFANWFAKCCLQIGLPNVATVPHNKGKDCIYTNCHPAGVQFCPAAGRSLPGNVKFCCKIQHLWYGTIYGTSKRGVMRSRSRKGSGLPVQLNSLKRKVTPPADRSGLKNTDTP